MTPQPSPRKTLLGVVAAAALVACLVGCRPTTLASNALAFTAGWLTGSLTVPTTTDTICFRNGVQIDCAELQ